MSGTNVRDLFDSANQNPSPVVHLVLKGSSQEVFLSELGVGISANSSDDAILRAVSNWFDLGDTLSGMVVERQPSGNISIRPSAVFG